MRRRRLALVTGAVVAAGLLTAPMFTAQAAPALLSQGHAVTASSSENAAFPASAAVDGDPGTRWSSLAADPQTLQVDLGSAQSASRVVLQLPAGWGARNETLSLQGSTNGSTWSTVKDSASYAFTPSANNTVTITFTATTQRYFRVTVTANTSWPAAQFSGLQVWNS